ncbi:hypothetical protein ACFL2J_07555 [Candidatus Omnitrophota bacterium]
MRSKIYKVLVVQLLVAFLFVPGLFAQAFSSTEEAVAEQGVLGEDENADTYVDNLKRWQSFTEKQREAIRQKAKRLSMEQKEALRAKARQFKEMPKEEQERIRRNFQRFKNMPEAEKNILKRKHEIIRKFREAKKAGIRQGLEKRKASLLDLRNPSQQPPAGSVTSFPTGRTQGQRTPSRTIPTYGRSSQTGTSQKRTGTTPTYSRPSQAGSSSSGQSAGSQTRKRGK